MFKLLLTTLSLIALTAPRVLSHPYPFRSLLWKTYVIETEVKYVQPQKRVVEIDSTEWYDFNTLLWDVKQHNDDHLLRYKSLQDYCESSKAYDEDFFESVFTCL